MQLGVSQMSARYRRPRLLGRVMWDASSLPGCTPVHISPPPAPLPSTSNRLRPHPPLCKVGAEVDARRRLHQVQQRLQQLWQHLLAEGAAPLIKGLVSPTNTRALVAPDTAAPAAALTASVGGRGGDIQQGLFLEGKPQLPPSEHFTSEE